MSKEGFASIKLDIGLYIGSKGDESIVVVLARNDVAIDGKCYEC